MIIESLQSNYLRTIGKHKSVDEGWSLGTRKHAVIHMIYGATNWTKCGKRISLLLRLVVIYSYERFGGQLKSKEIGRLCECMAQTGGIRQTAAVVEY